MAKTAKTKNQESPADQVSSVEQDNSLTDALATRTSPTEEAIARRAYEIFLQRGGQDGNDIENWLQAERELLEESES